MNTSRILVAAFTADDQLDDIGRARLWARLEDRIAEPVTPRRSWRPFALAAAGACIVLLVVLFARTPGRDADRVLVAPANTTLSTPLGPHARAALVGPAQLRIAGDAGDATTVKLERGTLLADFEGGPGRSLEIVTPGMRVTVVGTLFSVEVRGAVTCVAVAHGRVQAAIGARVAFVATGEQLCTLDVAPAALEPRVRDALARHERVIAEVTATPTPTPPAIATPAPPLVQPPIEPQVAPSRPVPFVPNKPARPTHVAPLPKTNAPTALAVAPPPKPEPSESAAPAQQVAPPKPDAPATQPPSKPAAPAQQVAQPPEPDAPAAQPPSRPAAPSQPTQPPKPDAPATQPPSKPVEQVARPAKPVVAPAAPPTAQELYRSAETALAHRDPTAADKALAQITDAQSSPLVPQALYDRARIAYDRKDYGAARRHLDALAKTKDSPLVESGRYLACRIAVEARDGSAPTCLREFRTTYPRSPHDRDVLGTLAQLAHAAGGCAAAKPYVDQLVRDYPHSTLAAGWRDTCAGAK